MQVLYGVMHCLAWRWCIAIVGWKRIQIIVVAVYRPLARIGVVELVHGGADDAHHVGDFYRVVGALLNLVRQTKQGEGGGGGFGDRQLQHRDGHGLLLPDLPVCR